MTGAHRITSRCSGVILMALLLGLVLGGIALLAAVDMWSLARQREREQQLLFVGNQYREAIRRYYLAAPSGTPRALPHSVEVLLEDDRYAMPVRHLRRAYPDPITGKPEWGLLRDGDGIAGVYSLSEGQPLKQVGFAPAYESFGGKARYRDWVFAFAPPPRAGLPPPAPVRPAPTPSPPTPPRPAKGKAL